MPEDTPYINPDLELIPFEGEAISADDELAADPLDEEFGQPVADLPEDEPEPFGRSWQFDHSVGDFVMLGGSPAVVTGIDTLAMRISNRITTARFAHPVYSGEMGMNDPYALIGQVLDAEAQSDWEDMIVDALQVEERITDLTEFTFLVQDDIVFVTFTYEIDDAQTATMENIPLTF